jgi:hypothetical protein
VEAGSASQRFVIGIGAGTAEMDTVVEGYAVTPQGQRKLGSGTLTASGQQDARKMVHDALSLEKWNSRNAVPKHEWLGFDHEQRINS